MQGKQPPLRECYIMLEHCLHLEVFFTYKLDIDEGTTAMDYLVQER